MSASGTGVFDDDVACDVRAQYRALLSEGKAPAEATSVVLRAWKEALADDEDGPVIWLALAALQGQQGGMQPQVKEEALRIIDSGLSLERWRSTGEPALVRSRQAVLMRLRAKLEAPPQPEQVKPAAKPKKRRPPLSKKSEWPQGEVFAYRLRSGRYVLLHVCDYLGNSRVGWAPIVALLDWRHLRIPAAESAQSLPYVIREDPIEEKSVLMFSLGGVLGKELPSDRVVRNVAMREAKPWKELVGCLGGCRCTRWRDLDRDLEAWTGWT